MSISSFTEHIRSQPGYQDQIVHTEHLPFRQASHRELELPLHPKLEEALKTKGLLPLYSHQAEAVNRAGLGKNVMVVTPAASGKTLCYNLPVLRSMLEEKGSRALYLFPTKALAQDQFRNLSELISLASPQTKYAVFDGDTPGGERPQIKKSAQIVLTNPDMLHLGILPNHQSWSGFFRRLKYIVIDEAHIYRGVFGSHVSNVIRRLRRICSYYRASPQFICCSATIANPKEHIEKLGGLSFDVIEEEGAPHGAKDFILWNPPIIDEAKMSRRSANYEAAFLLSELVRKEIRTIAFTRTRKLTELVYNYTKQNLAEPRLAKRIKPYRAGYLAEDRRQTERELFQGKLLGVVSTTALELGIDIGDLEATVLAGYPGSIASTWQQAGRSGRRSGKSLSFLIGLDNPLDQYIMNNPRYLFQKTFENALTNPDNPYVLKSHILCAAWEMPLTAGDEDLWGDGFREVKDRLEEEGLLKFRQGKSYPVPSVSYPAERVSIRSTSDHYYIILDTSQDNRRLETVESGMVMFQLHPGAIYLHQGESYLITELNIPARTAYAEPVDVPYYTQPMDLTELKVIKVMTEKDDTGIGICLGNVEVTTSVVAFRKKMQLTEEVIGEEPLDLPDYSFDTRALWFDIPERALERIDKAGLDFAGGLHAAEHACIALLPLFALCDRNDLGGVSTIFHPDTGKPQIFIYDAHPGGIGISEKGFELVRELWRETLKLIRECPCNEGCPSCIHSPKCGNNNHPLDKKAAAVILEELLRKPAQK